MKIILLNDIAKVGRKGAIVDVADGYALNSLIPQKKAVLASKQAIEQHAAAQKRSEAEKAARDAQIEEAIRSLDGKKVEISLKVSDKGSLFAKLHAKDIAAHLTVGTGVTVDEKWLSMKEPITTNGTHSIKLSYGSARGMVELEIK